jgi:predicted HicB family RNase H-like nuclease
MAKYSWAKGTTPLFCVRVSEDAYRLAVEEAEKQKIPIKEFVSHCIKFEILRLRSQ